uniref:G-protein coupled receptors family 1 profile domain-containing protein n=1 Tax=Propithecus coquereli TaxID=379532 RepID=A0A2K6EXP5_PROCO
MSGWSNGSSNTSYTSFLLMGFPGLQESRTILVLPFLSLYLVIVSANALVIHTVAAQRSLHQPMYLLIALLLAVNLCAASTVVPTMLFSFSAQLNHISLTRCLVQMFCIYFFIVFDCNILLVMALDRYVAICYPLRYPEIVTGQLLAGLVGVAAARSTCIVAPVVFLASRVPSAHMALMKLSCGDVSLNKTVGLTVRIFNRVLDMLLLGASYSRIIHAAFWSTFQGPEHLWLPPAGHLHHLLVNNDVHNLLSAFYLLLPCLVNPIIYGARTREIRQHLTTLFQRTQLPVPTEKPQSLSSHRQLPG